MMLALLLQAMGPPDPRASTAQKFDLAKVAAQKEACGEAHAENEVVVCASVKRDYVLPDTYAEKPLVARVKLGAAEASATAERKGPPGAEVPALMFSLKTRF